MLTSCGRTLSYKPQIKHVFTIPMLADIVRAGSALHHPLIFKAIFLVAFHSFLRISNLVPTSKTQFNFIQHLTRGDIIFGSPGVHILVKWTKTLQANNNHRLVPLARIPGSILCPVAALQQVIQRHPLSADYPLFAYMHNKQIVTFTQPMVRAALARVLASLGMDSRIGFHTFRRSGATLARELNISLQQTQEQGIWQSDAVWRYLHPSQPPKSLPTLFQHIFRLLYTNWVWCSFISLAFCVSPVFAVYCT